MSLATSMAETKTCVESLKLESLELRPYSLRRGGATWWFCQHGNLDRVMVLGRWQAQKTARMYLNESRTILAEMRLLHPTDAFFQNATPRNFETLEPLQSNRQSSKRGLGGRGRINQTSKKPAKKERKTNRWCPLGPSQGLGSGPPGWGGTVVRERPLLSKKGGAIIRLGSFVFFCSQLLLF